MEIDRDLVERITREVVSRLGAAAPSAREGHAGSGGLLAVLTCGCSGIDEAVAQLEQCRSRFGSITILLCTCAEGKAGEEVARRVRPDRLLKESQGATSSEAIASATAVAIPICTMTTAAQIGLLMSDSLASSVAIKALVRRLPLVIATNSMLASLTRGDYIPPGFQSVGAEHIERLRRVGARPCDIRELSATLTGAPSSSPASLAPSTAAPAYSATIECAPAMKNLEDFVMASIADDPSCTPCIAKVHSAIEQCIAAGACRVGTAGATEKVKSGVAGMIDHTLLKAEATPAEVEKLCAEAREYRFKSVCINPGYVSLAKRLLRGSGVLVCTVVGFPLGATTTATKAAETRDAVADGADEIDMVINIGALKSGEYEKVKHDMEAVVEAAKGRVVKVILETHFLTDEEKVAACQLAVAAGVDFVKTSTGFGGGGATVADIALMRKVVGPNLGVKASGGVRTTEDAQKMISAGASRIGASASIAIATGKKSETKGY